MEKLSDVNGSDMVVFYHADNDGKVCAAIINEIYPDAWCYPVNHNKDVRWELINPTVKTILIVDFSFPIDTMFSLMRNYRVIWIDHHPVIYEYAQQGFQCEGKQECSPGRSAAMLVWEYFHPNIPAPWVVRYISDYDTWKFDYGDDTRAFDAAIGQLDLSPIDKYRNTWNKLFRDKEFVHKLLITGKRILNFIKARNEVIVHDGAFETSIDGTAALACNVKDTNSSLFDSLHRDDIPIRILFRYFHNIRKVRVSVYSKDEEKHPANEIAKKYGGNGHCGAAGFVCDIANLPFNLPQKVDVKDLQYENILQPILDALDTDPLANRYANQNLIPIIYGSATPLKVCGINTVAINHPALFTNTWYVTGLNLEYDLGVFWNLCNNGWYRYRFYSLNPELTLEQLQKDYIPNGKIIGDSLWSYNRNNIFESSFEDNVPF